jgi:hypothetical protein
VRKVFLVTGFNNWGNTSLLFDMFGVRAFRKNRLHPFQTTGCDFLVLPKSNDDLHISGYVREYQDHMRIATKSGLNPSYIASAFCPTREQECWARGTPKNKTSIDLLRGLFSGDEIHMLLIEFKWCDHARLRLAKVAQYYASEPNVTIHKVSSQSHGGKLSAITSTLLANLP